MTSILACKAGEDSLFPYLSVMPQWLIQAISLYGNALWILAELNLVTETVVSLGYWAILVPTSKPSAARLVTLVNLTTHLFCWVASMIENLNSDFYLKFWHIFLVGIFCPCYLLFVIGLRESSIITSMPYGAILDYYQGTFAILFHMVFILAYYFFFTFYFTVSTVIKKQLAVLLSDDVIKQVASKSEFMIHIGLFYNGSGDQHKSQQANSFDNL
ncbi:predicted protein [Naegleria gruberi]|uniref:Predicted protein n=1 Tax=Naegleria gruberi TaxID=5762 RepID=D2W6P2_NAEGR|nr:uncharacterized protein NAEGRDRAFT_77086 [Naegleria gruberi]EFC35260.1 predicted protein [Naegleria gruberi]|eukprot:XP_002668004.1 predicted protein [Naegleria gruberi strain NEG-M]